MMFSAIRLRYWTLCRFVWVFLLPAGGCAGIPPRRAGHFHLSRQMKVTKAKTLFIWASRFGYMGSAGPRHALDKPHTCCDFFATRLASHRRGQGMFAQQTTALLLGPVGGVEERRGLGPRATARFVN